MLNFIRYSAVFLLIFFASSCAYHSGYMSGNAALSEANFKVVDFAIGTAESRKVLGFGGLKTDALVLEAKRNLYENHPLRAGQALANLSVDFKKEHYLLFSRLRVTISAEVVDFNPEAVNRVDSLPIWLSLDQEKSSDFFNIGDQVLYLRGQNMDTVLLIDIKDSYFLLQTLDEQNRIRLQKARLKQVFLVKQRPHPNHLRVGEIVQVPIKMTDVEGKSIYSMMDVRIIGLNDAFALIEYNSKSGKIKREVKSTESLQKKLGDY